MVNPRRGDVEATLDGRAHALRLTLGALAELEAAFGAEDLVALAARFESGRLSARDMLRVIGAGLRGAGAQISDDEVGRMQVDDGVAGAARLVARLLAAAFGEQGEAAPAVDAAARPSTPQRG
jgi:hypothetical protein